MLKLTDKGLRVVRELANRPEKKWYISELAEAAEVSISTASRTIEKLEEENAVRKEKRGAQRIVNIIHTDYLKDIVELLSNKNRYLREAAERFVEGLKEQVEHGNVEKCILFGSVARGTADFESDIDILVLVRKNEENIRDLSMIIADNVEEETGFHVSPIVMDSGKYHRELEADMQFPKAVEKDKEVLWNNSS